MLIAIGSLDDAFQKRRVVFECPMSGLFSEVDQPKGEMANPYMGQAMLVCGVESDWQDLKIFWGLLRLEMLPITPVQCIRM